ncbi:hypothetical protein PVAP13_2NG433300 [Panicum virgatum]|uniref:DUF4220 domain-containing protein n=1 Tax=Panicum virgatum TaxID=38727 RepID=A0A8T0VUT8_PANVG|nr:hypothetical protein PVAP13_2NG433300 [Panicum virgatum]
MRAECHCKCQRSMAQAWNGLIVQVIVDWEIQILLLLSFALQLLLFFVGGLRRRSSNALLRVSLWLAYLSADFIAVYALGYLSRHLPATTTTTANGDRCYQECLQSQALSSPSHPLTLLWAPFLLVHLGGQDTVTAFSLEDNELWLRHLLNMLVQVCLVLYVLWNSMAHNQLVIPAAFVFVAGVIKYGERIWALKCGSQKGLKSSAMSSIIVFDDSTQTTIVANESSKKRVHRGGYMHLQTDMKYSSIVKRALHSNLGVHEVFAGRKIYQMERDTKTSFRYYFHDNQPMTPRHTQVVFKLMEIELSMMYDDLYTKAKVIQARGGLILRCVSLTSSMVAFVLFLLMSNNKKRHYRSPPRSDDVVITYILFIGAFCLEAFAIILAIISPRALVFMEPHQDRHGRCSILARVPWSIFAKIQPEIKPWWSNSIGQYNFLNSCVADDRSRIAQMMVKVGAKEIWTSIRHIRHAKVTTETKDLIYQEINREEGATSSCPMPLPSELYDVIQRPFEEALLLMHVFTDLLLFKASGQANMGRIMQEMHLLIDSCKGMSDYMLFLLVVHPALLPVGGNVHDLLVIATKSFRDRSGGSKESFLIDLPTQSTAFENAFDLTGQAFSLVEDMVKREEDLRAALQMLAGAWVRLLIYAAGKSRPEEHARRLSMGGELLTFIWLLMAHNQLGDLYYEVDLVEKGREREIYMIDSVNCTNANLLFERIPRAPRHPWTNFEEDSENATPNTVLQSSSSK